jgi:hypothetical protein
MIEVFTVGVYESIMIVIIDLPELAVLKLKTRRMGLA